jgi:hypothetical protein
MNTARKWPHHTTVWPELIPATKISGHKKPKIHGKDLLKISIAKLSMPKL